MRAGTFLCTRLVRASPEVGKAALPASGKHARGPEREPVEALKQLALSRRGGGGGGRGGRPMRSPRLRSTRQTDGSSGGRGSGGGGSVRQAASVEVSAPFARASAPASPLPYSATSLPLAAAGVARVARDEAAVQSEGSNSSRQSGQAPRRVSAPCLGSGSEGRPTFAPGPDLCFTSRTKYFGQRPRPPTAPRGVTEG
eukprot:365776-Chlamydomonas_euryale.AAC.10